MGHLSKLVKHLRLRMLLLVLGLVSCQPATTDLSMITPSTETLVATLAPEVVAIPSPSITSPPPVSTPSTAGWILYQSDTYFYLINAGRGGSTRYQGFDLSWSPDGQRIVFTDRKNIYVMHVDGSGLTVVTNFDKSDKEGVRFYPHWSPDGKRIAFWSSDGFYYALYVVSADGSDLSYLASIGLAGLGYKEPIWSPNSRQIVYSRTSEHEKRPSSIFIIDVGLGAGKHLTDRGDEYCLETCPSDFDPIWAPNGQQIVFTSTRDGNYETYRINSDGSHEVRLTDDPAYDGELNWSPDGQRIVFVSARDGNPEIYVMNADGSDQSRLTNNTAVDGQPAWSPDGQRIVFASARDGNDEIYLMNADGSNQIRLTNTPTEEDGHPIWSPQLEGNN
ncbi:MAG: TolB family protein [Chloroflexi bacterium]|nr:TolB family protein [Chloroflexota bacterium]